MSHYGTPTLFETKTELTAFSNHILGSKNAEVWPCITKVVFQEKGFICGLPPAHRALWEESRAKMLVPHQLVFNGRHMSYCENIRKFPFPYFVLLKTLRLCPIG